MINWLPLAIVGFTGVYWGIFAGGLWKKRRRGAGADWEVWYATAPFFRLSARTGFLLMMGLACLAALAVGWGLVHLLVLHRDVDTGWFVLLSLAPLWASVTLPVNRLRIGDGRLDLNGVTFALEDVGLRRENGFVIFTARGILGEAGRIPERFLEENPWPNGSSTRWGTRRQAMQEKTGRPRRLVFRDELGIADPGTQWMAGMFFELGDRVFDQVVHLPGEVLHACPRDSYLSPARVVLHLVATDLRRLSPVLGVSSDTPYAASLSQAQSPDLASLATRGLDVVALLQAHLDHRRARWVPALARPGLLDEDLEDPHFATKRDLLGHLVWHWSFHSGHLGAVTLEAGYEYHWTSTPRGKA